MMQRRGASRARPVVRPLQVRRRRTMILLILLSFVAVAVGAFAFLDVSGPFERASTAKAVPKNQIIDAWVSADRSQVLEYARNSLESRPLDSFYLSYRGFAAFYLALEKPEGGDKSLLLDESVTSLRKALASGRAMPAKAQAEYILGKAYYEKGEPWFDLAIRYMEKALADGYRGPDGEEYLAALYAGMGDHRKASPHFDKALERTRDELLLIAAAKTRLALDDGARAKSLLDEAVVSGKNAAAMQQARLLLGEMAQKAGDTSGAERYYLSILEMDPGSAEAWHRLGIIYASRNDPVRARAAWRKAATLDPTHVAARQKLSEKL